MADHFLQKKRSPDHKKRSKAVRIGMAKSRGRDSVHIWSNNVVKPTAFFSECGQRETGVLTTSPHYLTMREGCIKERKESRKHAPPFIDKKSGNVDKGWFAGLRMYRLRPRENAQFQPNPRGQGAK